MTNHDECSLWCRIGELFGLCSSCKSKLYPVCPNCKVKLIEDNEGKYDFRCPECNTGFHESDLPKQAFSPKKKKKKGNGTDKAPSEPVPSPVPPTARCLYVFAVLVPNSELNKWFIESGGQTYFTEKLKEILLQNNVWVGVAKESLLYDLKQYFRSNAKENGDIFVFMIENQSDSFKQKIDRNAFYRSDLRDMFDEFAIKQIAITEFTPVNSEIEILSENSPFDIHFIHP